MTTHRSDSVQIEPSVETIRLAFDAAADALLILSNDGVVLHTNAAGLQAIEADSAEAARGIRLGDLLTLDCQDEWHRVREGVSAGESRRWSMELVGLRGTHRRMEMHAASMRIAGGGSGHLAACRDCSAAARQAAHHLAATRDAEWRSGLSDNHSDDEAAEDLAQARLAALVECCDDAVISKAVDETVTSWNAGAERLFGYTAAESVGRSILAIVPPDRHDEEAMILNRLWRGERVEHFETQRLTKDGRLVDVSLTVSPIRNSRGVIVDASNIARDIGERHRLNDAREKLLEAERSAKCGRPVRS